MQSYYRELAAPFFGVGLAGQVSRAAIREFGFLDMRFNKGGIFQHGDLDGQLKASSGLVEQF